MPGSLGVKFIALTYRHAMLIGNDGQLYGFGFNDANALGVGDSSIRYTPTLVVDNNNSFRNKTFAHVAVSPGMGIACTTDGSLYTWGYGGTDARGTLDPGDFPLFILFPGKNVTYVAAAGSGANTKSIMITSDGKVFTMGNNNGGTVCFVV
jgi:alpha-tubulin suppressor-like RCC1 family protein